MIAQLVQADEDTVRYVIHAVPKLSRPGPGRPAGSRNAQRAARHNPGKTPKSDKTVQCDKKQPA
jgi:hypothetical protein